VVAAAQIAPIFLDRDATLDKICHYAQMAAQQGCKLVVFPETVLPGYPYWTLTHDPLSHLGRFNRRLYKQAVEIPSPCTDKLCETAKKTNCFLVVGLNEREGGTLYNSQLFISDEGRILGCRRKLVPTSQERMVWGRGDGSDLPVYDTCIGVLGGLICYEHSNALFRYAVQAQGEQIHIASWPGGMPFINAIMDEAVRHYAFESQCFVISVTSLLSEEILEHLADGSGVERLNKGGGYSLIVDPRGKYLAGPELEEEGLITAELELDEIADAKMIVDSSGHYARPDVVQLHVNRKKQAPLVDD
jgi:aliphatic nitrilase